MNQNRPRICIKSVLDKPVKHTTSFNCDNKISVYLFEGEFFLFHIVRNPISSVPYIVLTMNLLLGVISGYFLHYKIPNYSSPVLFRPQLKILTHTPGYHLKILRQEIRFI